MADQAATLVGNFVLGGIAIPINASNTGQKLNSYVHALATASTNVAIDYEFTNSKVIAVAITSDQNISIYTNAASTGSPTQTLSITGSTSGGTFYIKNVLGTNPFTADVTAIYITNASGSTANIQILVLVTTP